MRLASDSIMIKQPTTHSTRNQVFQKIWHMLLPVNCANCQEALWGDPNPFFCRECWSQIQPISQPTCPCCGIPFSSEISLTYSPNHVCGSCRDKRPAFSKAWTLYPYQSPLKEAIGLFKYRGKVSLANPLAILMRDALPILPAVDIIIPVPLHGTRLREREYNQSLILAHHLSRHLNIPLSHTSLRRTRPTVPQTSLKREKRLKNLRGSFSVHQPEQVKGKTALLIDDVLTTGTTVNECAKVLRASGMDKVYVMTLARMV